MMSSNSGVSRNRALHTFGNDLTTNSATTQVNPHESRYFDHGGKKKIRRLAESYPCQDVTDKFHSNQSVCVAREKVILVETTDNSAD